MSLQIAVLGIDLGKNNCSLAALDGSGQIRAAATRAPRKYPQNRIQAEAVYDGDGGLRGSTSPSPSVTRQRIRGAAHFAGTCASYVKAQKNDDVDAEVIAEAATRPTMRFVELKSAEQLDMQVLHRARDRLIAERTALINQLRAVLMERGITVPQGRRKLEQALAQMLEGCDNETALSPRVRALINDMREDGAHWTTAFVPSTTNLPRVPARTNEPDAWPPFRGSACSAQPRWWLPSVTGRVLRAVAISRLGLASFHGRRLREASRALKESASVAMCIYASF